MQASNGPKKGKPKNRSKPDLKIVLVGDANVGKTSLLLRYLERRFVNISNTVGVSFLLKQWGNHSIALWDTAGEERYSGLGSLYFRSASAAILVYDITSENSLEVLRYTYTHTAIQKLRHIPVSRFCNPSSFPYITRNRFVPLLESASENCLKIVVATKLDLVSNGCKFPRKVSTEQGLQLAKILNPSLANNCYVPYFETSSLTGYNVDKVFQFAFEYFFPNAYNSSTPTSRCNVKRDRNSIVHLESVCSNADVSKKNRCCES